MKKITYVFFFIFTALFLARPNTSYASNFLTSYDVTYTISESGLTHTLFNITLTNTSGQYYASSYKLEVGFKDLKNVKVYDSDGPVNPTIEKTGNGQSIDVVFNRRVVGTGNNLSFNLSFDTEDLAKKQGNIWEINIPGIANQNDFSKFNVLVTVPQSFGKPVYIKPAQQDNSLRFTKEQLGKGGISLAFGKTQTSAFNLKYHLKNTNLFPIKTEIAIPPSTNYQNVFIDNIYPRPVNVIQDKDGNWLAQYSLLPSQKVDVTVNGRVELSLYPKKEPLSNSDLNEYLKEKPYWEISNSKIKELGKILKTPGAIYDYVVTNLNYDFSRVTENKPRLGAAKILENPNSAVCLEFTDLFIALARSAGIPAREVDGFAYTENSTQRPLSLVKDVLHAWPEYYDKDLETWVMVDPTWGNTTGGVDYFNILDFDHFAFVIKGLNSQYPIPAGGNKDINIDFIPPFSEPQPNYNLNLDFPKSILSGLPIDGSIIIENKSSSFIPGKTAVIESGFLSPHFQEISFSGIPPFGRKSINLSFEKLPFLTNKAAAVKITVEEKSVTQNIKVSPFSFFRRELIGGLIGIIIISISLTAAITRRLPFFRRKR